MDRTEYINRITTHLAVLAERVRSSSHNGRMDINVDSEMTVCGLVNRLMDWELTNLNDRRANFPGIDLADRHSRVAVQVTSTATGHKINHTLDEFLKNGFDADFDRLIVIIITNDRLPAATARARGNFRFDPERDIWNLSAITGFVRNLADPWKLEEIARFLDQELGGRSVLPKYPLPGVPSASPSFVAGSRDEELKAAREILAAGQPVFLWGLGGMGKTETAIQLAAGNAYFLRFQDSLRRTILNADFSGYRFEGVDNDRRELEYRERLGILRRQYAGAMLIIDNFDCPGRSFADLTGEETYSDLTQLDLDLVFTTRADAGDLGVRVDRIMEDDLLTLMRKSCKNPSVTDEQLRELIRAVDGHTLMVDLMAKTLQESLGAITPEEMLEAFRGGKLKGKKLPSVHKHQQGRSAQGRIDDHLRTLFDMSAMNPSEKAVLRCATLLPEDGMDALLFRNCLDDEQREVPRKWREKLFGKKPQIIPSEQDAFTRLTKTGWLRIDDVTNLLTIHPVVREVCREVLEPSDANCEEFGRRLREHGPDLSEFDAVALRQFAEVFSMGSDQLKDIWRIWAWNAALLWLALEQGQRLQQYSLRVMEQYEKYLYNAHDLLARVYAMVGNAYYLLRDYPKALEYAYKMLESIKKEQPTNQRMLATAYNNLGCIYEYMDEPEKALAYKRKAFEIRKKALPPDDPDIAQSFHNIGYSLNQMGDYETALDYAQKAQTILGKSFSTDHPMYALAYDIASFAYVGMGDHEKALECEREMVSLLEKKLPSDHPHLIRAYVNLGKTYCDDEDYDNARKCYEKALAVCEASVPPNPMDIVDCYRFLGSVLYYQGKWEQAFEYYEKARLICEEEGTSYLSRLAEVYIDMGTVRNKMRDYEGALRYRESALEIFEQILPADHPNLGVAYNNLGDSYNNLGDTAKALACGLRAKEIWEKVYPPDHPNLITSARNLAIAYSELEDYERALELYLSVHQVIKQSRPSDHPDVARSYDDVGSIYDALGDHRKALEYKLNALAIFEKVLPPEHPHLAASYNNVGCTYGEMGEHGKALEYLEKALDIWQRVLPAGHPYIATVESNIAWYRRKMEQRESSIP